MGAAPICRRCVSNAKTETCTQSPNWQRFGLFAVWLLGMSGCVKTGWAYGVSL